jgi:hypothetical protein
MPQSGHSRPAAPGQQRQATPRGRVRPRSRQATAVAGSLITVICSVRPYRPYCRRRTVTCSSTRRSSLPPSQRTSTRKRPCSWPTHRCHGELALSVEAELVPCRCRRQDDSASCATPHVPACRVNSRPWHLLSRRPRCTLAQVGHKPRRRLDSRSGFVTSVTCRGEELMAICRK